MGRTQDVDRVIDPEPVVLHVLDPPIDPRRLLVKPAAPVTEPLRVGRVTGGGELIPVGLAGLIGQGEDTLAETPRPGEVLELVTGLGDPDRSPVVPVDFTLQVEHLPAPVLVELHKPPVVVELER